MPGYHEFLKATGATPAERFWATPAVSATGRSNALGSLLSTVFPEGLAPLADKVDELVERTLRVADDPSSPARAAAAGGHMRPLSPTRKDHLRALRRPDSPSELNNSPKGLGGRRSGVGVGSGSAGARVAPWSASAPVTPRSPGGKLGSPPSRRGASPLAERISSMGVGGDEGYGYGGGGGPLVPPWQVRTAAHSSGGGGLGLGALGSTSGAAAAGHLSPPVASASSSRPWTVPGGGGYRRSALPAAGILWERSQEVSHAPALRQCLTWEEVQTLKL